MHLSQDNIDSQLNKRLFKKKKLTKEKKLIPTEKEGKILGRK